jgi:translation initiation factor 5A
MDVPNVSRTEYTLINIDDVSFGVNRQISRFSRQKLMCRFLCLPRSQGFLNLMLPDGTPKDDVKVPEGQIGTDIEAAFESGKEVSVTIIAAMGEEQAITFKTTD